MEGRELYAIGYTCRLEQKGENRPTMRFIVFHVLFHRPTKLSEKLLNVLNKMFAVSVVSCIHEF